jgi:hypothetical protein
MTATSEKWVPIASAPENVLVWTKIDDELGERNVQRMVRRGRLWWIDADTPRAMYVYYTPTHWQAVS